MPIEIIREGVFTADILACVRPEKKGILYRNIVEAALDELVVSGRINGYEKVPHGRTRCEPDFIVYHANFAIPFRVAKTSGKALFIQDNHPEMEAVGVMDVYVRGQTKPLGVLESDIMRRIGSYENNSTD